MNEGSACFYYIWNYPLKKNNNWDWFRIGEWYRIWKTGAGLREKTNRELTLCYDDQVVNDWAFTLSHLDVAGFKNSQAPLSGFKWEFSNQSKIKRLLLLCEWVWGSQKSTSCWHSKGIKLFDVLRTISGQRSK